MADQLAVDMDEAYVELRRRSIINCQNLSETAAPIVAAAQI